MMTTENKKTILPEHIIDFFIKKHDSYPCITQTRNVKSPQSQYDCVSLLLDSSSFFLSLAHFIACRETGSFLLLLFTHHTISLAPPPTQKNKHTHTHNILRPVA